MKKALFSVFLVLTFAFLFGCAGSPSSPSTLSTGQQSQDSSQPSSDALSTAQSLSGAELPVQCGSEKCAERQFCLLDDPQLKSQYGQWGTNCLCRALDASPIPCVCPSGKGDGVSELCKAGQYCFAGKCQDAPSRCPTVNGHVDVIPSCICGNDTCAAGSYCCCGKCQAGGCDSTQPCFYGGN